MTSRTDVEIVQQTIQLCKDLASVMGWKLLTTMPWNSGNPRVQMVWTLACIAQVNLTVTCPEDALSGLEYSELELLTLDEAPMFAGDGI